MPDAKKLKANKLQTLAAQIPGMLDACRFDNNSDPLMFNFEKHKAGGFNVISQKLISPDSDNLNAQILDILNAHASETKSEKPFDPVKISRWSHFVHAKRKRNYGFAVIMHTLEEMNGNLLKNVPSGNPSLIVPAANWDQPQT